jgi:hypothetical protein
MRSGRRRLAIAVGTVAAAFAGPATGASAQVPVDGGAGFMPPAIGVSAIGGNQIGAAGCVGTNRPSFGGNSGSTSAISCGTPLSFIGPQIGQISAVVGPVIIGSPFSDTVTSAGPVTQVGP